MTLNDAFQIWSEDNRLHVRRSTMQSYMGPYNNHIRDSIGRRDLKDITHRVVDEYFDALQTPAATKVSIRKALVRVYSYLAQCRVWDYNPVSHIRIDRPKIVIPVFSPHEMRQFLTSTRRSGFYPLYLLLAHTGLRLSEALGLQWQDVSDGTLTVARQYNDRKIAPPKNKYSCRIIDMSDELTHELTLLRARSGAFARKHDFVFHKQDGTPYCKSWINKVAKQEMLAAGVPHVTMHSFRHYHATWLMESRISVQAIVHRLGWASADMLLQRYGHVTYRSSEQIQRVLNDM